MSGTLETCTILRLSSGNCFICEKYATRRRWRQCIFGRRLAATNFVANFMKCKAFAGVGFVGAPSGPLPRLRRAVGPYGVKLLAGERSEIRLVRVRQWCHPVAEEEIVVGLAKVLDHGPVVDTTPVLDR